MTIEYSEEILWAMQQRPEEFAVEARLMLALKLYETGKLDTALAAEIAGLTRNEFIYELGRHGLTAFGVEPDELEEDLVNARRAGRSE
jgi:predicted HTH domain antitoxin